MKEAFANLHFEQRTQNAVVLLSSHVPKLSFKIEAEYAQRGSLPGYERPRKAGFRYISQMDPPERRRYQVQDRWV